MSISTGGQINGTTISGTLTTTATRSSSDPSKVKFNFSHDLSTSSGYSHPDYEIYTAYINIDGQTVSYQVKPKSEGLYKDGPVNGITGSATLSINASSTSVSISYYIQTNKNGYGSVVTTPSSGSETIYFSAGYLTLSAPSNVKVKQTLINQNQEVELSWSDVSSAGATSVSSYQYYYKNSSNGSWISLDTISSTSVKIKLTQGQGTRYYFGVRAVGNPPGYSSSIASASNSTLINSAPSDPSTLSYDSKIVKSTVTNVTLPEPDGASDVNNNLSYYQYKIEPNGTWTKWTSSSTVTLGNPGGSTTIKFRAVDALGLTSSGNKSCTITRNKKPIINTPTITSTKHDFHNDLDVGSTSKLITTSATVTDSIGSLKYNLTVHYTAYNSSALQNNNLINFPYSKDITSYLTNGFSSSFDIYDIIGDQKQFCLEFNVNDGYDDAEPQIIYEVNGQKLTTAPTPVFQYIYNQHSNFNIISGNRSDLFANQIRFIFTYDEKLLAVTRVCTCKMGSDNKSIKYITSGMDDNKTFCYFDYNVTSDSYGNTHIFNLSLGNIISGEAELVRVQKFDINIAKIEGGQIFKPFTDNTDTIIQFSNLSTKTTLEELYEWCALNNEVNWITYELISNKETFNLSSSLDSTININNEWISRNINIDKNFFNLIKTIGALNKNYSFDIKITITNMFGETYSGLSSNYGILQFIEEPIITFTTANVIYNFNGMDIEGTEVVNEQYLLLENNQLKFEPIIEYYNNYTYNIEVLIKRGNSDWEVYLSTTSLTDGTGDWNSPKKLNFNNLIKTIGEISSEYNCNFKIKVSSDVHNAEKECIEEKPGEVNKKFKTYPFTSKSSFILNDISVIEGNGDEPDENIITFSNYTEKITEPVTIDTTYEILYESTDYETGAGTDKSDSNTPNQVIHNGSLKDPNQIDASFYKNKLREIATLTYEIDGITYTNSKTSISPIYILYYNAPTISPRQNRIGINYSGYPKDTNLDDLLYIKQFNNNKIIYFEGIDDSDNENLKTSLMSLNLSNGEFKGIVIDGGTW